jgi:hypothetical protein
MLAAMRMIVLLVLAASCAGKRDEKAAPAAATAQPATPAAAPATCLADRMGVLSELGGPRPCADDPVPCERDCDAGDGNACWNLAAARIRAGDPESSDPYFERGCRHGHGNSCTNVAAGLWSEVSGEPAHADYECARRMFEKICAATDDHFACGMDGRLRLDRMRGDDVERGRAILERSCTELRGFPCRILALAMEEGQIPGGSPEKIRSLMAEACAGHDEPACAEFTTVDETFIGP